RLIFPATITAGFAGTAQVFQQSLRGQGWLLLATVVVIYIVLGILYESFIHPITILSGLPAAGVGALLTLMLFKMDLSVIAIIGIVMLIGIVKKNAIMMIDFAIERRKTPGTDAETAIHEACLLRFRPIMMTTMQRSWARCRSPSASAPAPNCAGRSASPSSAVCWSRRPLPSTSPR